MVGVGLNRHMLRSQTGTDRFCISAGLVVMNDQRTLGEHCLQHLFGLLHTIRGQPGIHQPLRHGIAHRQAFHRILRRIGNVPLLRSHFAKHAVDKALQSGKAALGRQFDCLIADSGIRHRIHIQQLVYSHPQYIADDRLHFLHRNTGAAADDVIHL